MADEVKPPEKPTTELPAVPAWAVELMRTTKEGFARLGGDISLVANDISLVKERVTLLESWRAEQDLRISRASLRVKELDAATSQVDLEIQAKQAEEILKRQQLESKIADTHARVEALSSSQEAQLAILSRLDKVASNPLVKTLAASIGTAILTWLASKGVR
jgi:hypothetical protein